MEVKAKAYKNRNYYASDTCCGGVYVRSFSSKASRDEWCSEASSRYPVSARQAMSSNTSAIIVM